MLSIWNKRSIWGQRVDLRPKGRSEAKRASQANNSCSFQLAQISLKPLPIDASRRELSESVFKIEKGALCVELWQFYCSIRISVSMLYILFPHNHKSSKEGRIAKKSCLKVDLKPTNHGFLDCSNRPKTITNRRVSSRASESVFKIEKGALCVELLPFYCSIRILVPMSYMKFWLSCKTIFVYAFSIDQLGNTRETWGKLVSDWMNLVDNFRIIFQKKRIIALWIHFRKVNSHFLSEVKQRESKKEWALEEGRKPGEVFSSFLNKNLIRN